MNFEEMGLGPRALAGLAKLGITEPTPIQTQAIPPAMAGRDVMGLAQTGTGKTAAFALPLIHALESRDIRVQPKTVRGLVLAPTRELANQIADAMAGFAAGGRLKIGVVVGGSSIFAQTKRLARGTDILIATPGRLIDLIERKAVDLSGTGHLVLDEADQMLDLGFIHALRKIALLLPAKRQTMLFSATMPKQMAELAKAYLSDPVRVEAARPGMVADKIDQSVHFVHQGDKLGLLKNMLEDHKAELALVFARTKHGADRLATQLEREGFFADAIHGDRRQRERERTLAAFREKRLTVLVATDVAARGIDIPDVRHVYNFDLPNVPENYVHRIGRTARAGADGRALAFCAPHEMDLLEAVEKSLGQGIPVAGGAPWRAQRQKPQGRPAGRKPQGKFGGPAGGNSGKPDAGQRRRRRPAGKRLAAA
ncbi:MAG: DEAD/DEAH box helicase [Alphaproteobacteria bacterium]